MRTPALHPQRLSDYTNIPFEIFIAVFSILPFFVLVYFYPMLPERVPLFMNLNGEVAVWAEKSMLSVFPTILVPQPNNTPAPEEPNVYSPNY